MADTKYTQKSEIKAGPGTKEGMDLPKERKYLYSHPNLGKKRPLETWPRTTEIHCDNCSYPIPGIPSSICENFNDTLREFECFAFYCDDSCALAKLYERMSFQLTQQLMDTNLFHLKLNTVVRGAVQDLGQYPRLPKTELKKFGGSLSIEEYRQRTVADIVH